MVFSSLISFLKRLRVGLRRWCSSIWTQFFLSRLRHQTSGWRASRNRRVDSSTRFHVRAVSALPVAVGFGISTAEQVREVWRFADAAVIGSAIVSQIQKLADSRDLVKHVGEFARSLIAPT